MPHVIVKFWPGQSEARKKQLADRITKDVVEVFHSDERSISVAMEEIAAEDWAEEVYRPDIVGERNRLYKKPGYALEDLPKGRKRRS